MSTQTPNFGLVKPGQNELYNVSVFNENMDTIDTEMHKPPLTINGIQPDPVTRDTSVTRVALADNLSTDVSQFNNTEFIERTSGGGSSIESGVATLVSVQGNMIRTGYVAESLTHTESEGLTVTINEATFKAYVSGSDTYVFEYTDAWTPALTNYGITVAGTPVDGDTITVVYVEEQRGTITTATPLTFNSTGWNLYNNSVGYAKVIAYSTQYGYKIGGSYTNVQFATTVSGTKSDVDVDSNGLFNIEENGYIFVTGGNTTTYIYPTWTDWINGYTGNFQTYSLYTIDLAEIMVSFPNGLCAIGTIRDEINLNTQRAIQRIERMAYSAENLASVIASGVAYIYDSNYIYAELDDPNITTIEINKQYNVSDHGIEFFNGTTIPVYTEILYGENLKDKLRTDVLTISQQTLTAGQKTQVQTNIGAASASALTAAVASLTAGIASATAFSTATPNAQTSKVTDRGSSIVKFGNLVICCIECEVADSVGTATELYRIPSGFRPSNTVGSFYAIGKTSSGDISPRNGSSFFTINSSGNMVQKWSATYSGWFAAIFIYSV